MLTKCPDCGGNFEEGAIIDFTHGGGVVVQRHAKATIPTDNKISLKAEADFKDIRRVISYRCVKCNRIFSYAQNIVLGENLWQSQKKGIVFGLFIGFIIMIFALLFSFSIGAFR